MKNAILVLVGALCACLLFASFGSLAAANGAVAEPAAPTSPNAQDFQDVPADNTFAPFLHNLYVDGVVGGYTCTNSQPDLHCVPPGNLPYYRPGNAVTRLQMTKFIDLGRRSIADAVGTSLNISGTAAIAVYGQTRSTGYGVYGRCLTAGNNCYAITGVAQSGDLAGYFSGGRGITAYASDAPSGSQLNYAGSFTTATSRAGYFKSGNSGLYSLYVDTAGGPTQATSGLEVNGSVRMEGNLYVAGSKSGYVVDVMQNVGNTPLEPGDVVVIVGSSAPVMGEIPVVTVKKASSAYDTGVAGVVDQVMYVPDAATKTAYAAQERRMNAVTGQESLENKDVAPSKADAATALITDEMGTVHAQADATSVAPGGYLSVVTLGAYKAIKVDASFGAIKTGDLLVSSPHAGYAMKATDKSAALGAILGKALGTVESGTATIPVLVSLK